MKNSFRIGETTKIDISFWERTHKFFVKILRFFYKRGNPKLNIILNSLTLETPKPNKIGFLHNQRNKLLLGLKVNINIDSN